MDIEKLLNENEELLLQRIANLKNTIPGTSEDKEQIAAYDAVFKHHIALAKVYEEAVNADYNEEINNKKIDIEKKKLEQEKEIAFEKLKLDKILADKPKVEIALQAVGVIGAIVTPIACEILKQKMHWDVSKLVLNFEEHGSITSSIGKAEFRR